MKPASPSGPWLGTITAGFNAWGRSRLEDHSRMLVSDAEVDLPRPGELLRHCEDGCAIARTKAGVDHQHRLVADDVADVRDEGNAVVRNHLHVLGDRLQPVGLDQRRRWRGSLG